MGIRYGRPLSLGPRPAAPRPRLGGLGPSWEADVAASNQQRDAKRKQSRKAKEKSTSTPSQPSKEKRKRQKASNSQRVFRAAAGGTSSGSRPGSSVVQGKSDRKAKRTSTRVIVTWVKGPFRYIAWGTRGIQALEGWKKCDTAAEFRGWLATLGRDSLRLVVRPGHGDVVEILDQIIMAGKLITPRSVKEKASVLSPKSARSSRRRSDAQQAKKANGDRGAWNDLSRHEALVTRPSSKSSSRRQRAEKPERSKSDRDAARARMLVQQRGERGRLWHQPNHGTDKSARPDDLMHRALQGGAPS
jgi:hypothetical protein